MERISGPSTGSAHGKRAKGRTASFTATCFMGLPTGSPRSAMRSPSMRRTAWCTMGTPVALATKGTVRDARGLASITYAVPSRNANCTLSSPRTPIASASIAAWRRTSATDSGVIPCGGSTHAESPECTPASSTCSITPAIQVSSPSESASTSISTAPARNRSTITSPCGFSFTSQAFSSSGPDTIAIARPPST